MDNEIRPTWSVMIPVYNCGEFLEMSLRSVLAQALPENEMQIEVVDDCSTDIDVQELVREIGRGRVSYFRQPCNVGNLRNFETCLNLSKGHYIHLLHCDDLVHPGFYHELGELFSTYPQIGAAFCRHQYIGEEGDVIYCPDAEAPVECVLENWLYRLAKKQRIQCASICVKRKVYEELGGFCGVHYCEDWEMWARIATRYPFGYTPKVLASHRRHLKSVSGHAITTATNFADLEYVIRKINNYLPEHQRRSALYEARKFYAHYALRTAHMLWAQLRYSKAAIAQLRKAWAMHKDVALASGALTLLLRMILNRP